MAGRLSSGSLLHCGQSIYSLWLKCWSSSLSSTHHLQRETQRMGVTGTRAPWGSRWPPCHHTGLNILHLSWRERETWGENSTLCPYQQDVTMMTTSWGEILKIQDFFFGINMATYTICLKCISEKLLLPWKYSIRINLRETDLKS